MEENSRYKIIFTFPEDPTKDIIADLLVLFFQLAHQGVTPELISRLLKKNMINVWIKALFKRRETGKITPAAIAKILKEILYAKRFLPPKRKGDPFAESFHLAIDEMAKKMHEALCGRCNNTKRDCYLFDYCTEVCGTDPF
jgi:hypothetical protein